jgi:hypothetical protein
MLLHKQEVINVAEAPLLLPSHAPPPSSSMHEHGTTNNAKTPSLLPSHTPPPLSLPHKQGTTNNATALLSVLPPPLPPSSLCKQGGINNVKAPLLPSRVLLLLPSLHEKGATNGAEAPLSSTGEQGTADIFKVPHHRCANSGQPTAADGMRQHGGALLVFVEWALSSLPTNSSNGSGGTIARSALTHLAGMGRVNSVNYSTCLHRLARMVALSAHPSGLVDNNCDGGRL